jgi:predicted DNA-binding transcriptional regulator AlpA
VARITGLSVASVRRWRLFRQGPKYIKIGAAVRYKAEDVAAWIASSPPAASIHRGCSDGQSVIHRPTGPAP